MQVKFTQGIIQKTDNFLTVDNFYITIDSRDCDSIISFANGSENYIFVESRLHSPWKISSSFSDTWYYWEIDQNSGDIIYGNTSVNPFIDKGYGYEFPKKPIKGQHFFNKTDNKLYVWRGTYWKHVLRVFACKLSSNSILEVFKEMSQVAIYKTLEAGSILYKDGFPLKKNNSFVTSSDFVKNLTEKRQLSFTAEEGIPKHYAVSKTQGKYMGLSSNLDPSKECIGLSINTINKYDNGKIITEGIITDLNWNFKEEDKLVYVGLNGELTTDLPTRFSFQKIGHVLGENTIYLKIEPKINIYSRELLQLLNLQSIDQITDDELARLKAIVLSLYQFTEFDSIDLTQPKDNWQI